VGGTSSPCSRCEGKFTPTQCQMPPFRCSGA